MSRQAGFTLVELVTVMLLIGVLSAVAIARYNPDRFEVHAAAKELVAAIRYAQEMSMSHTGANNYQVSVTAGGYQVTQSGVAIPHPVTGAAGYASSWSGVGLSPTGTISFNGYGEPSLSGGLAWGGNQESIVLTAGGDTSAVSIQRLTGYVR